MFSILLSLSRHLAYITLKSNKAFKNLEQIYYSVYQFKKNETRIILQLSLLDIRNKKHSTFFYKAIPWFEMSVRLSVENRGKVDFSARIQERRLIFLVKTIGTVGYVTLVDMLILLYYPYLWILSTLLDHFPPIMDF